MNTRRIFLPLIVILVVLFQLATPGMALADDDAPPEPTSTEVVEETGDELPPVEPGDDLPPAEPGDELPPAEPAAETPTVPEILDAAPPGTAIVVVDDQGQVEPLATLDAAEILANSDPVWCPPGFFPGDVECLVGLDVTDLIVQLNAAAALDPAFGGDGTIYFQDGIYAGTEPVISFDAASLDYLDALALQGGWNLTPGSEGDLGGTTTFTVPVIIDWADSVTLNDILVDLTGYTGAPAPALTVATSGGDIVLDNTDAVNNPDGPGAVLDTAYIVDNDPDPLVYDPLLTGAGSVTVTNGDFGGANGNDGVGLLIWANGAVTISEVLASGNADTGLYVDNCLDFWGTGCAGTGDVDVSLSTFDANDGFGMYLGSGGSIFVDQVNANANGWDGADLLNDEGSGIVAVTDSTFSDNDDYGLVILSAGEVTLDQVVADLNRIGALVDTLAGTAGVTIDDSRFNQNVWYGLWVESHGDIALTDVAADWNGEKGAYLITDGTSVVDVLTSQFNHNGSYGIYAHSTDGDITLETVTASFNGVKGAYLQAACVCVGNIFVLNSSFEANGSYGLYAITQQGNITVENVVVDGNDVTTIGAFLKSHDGGVITVTDSTFVENTVFGLQIVGTNDVLVENVIASDNGSDGAMLMSGWTFACFGPLGIDVTVTGGTYANNGGYGFQVAPGPLGTLTLAGTINFLANTDGDYFVDLTDPCIPEPPKPPQPPAPPSNVVQVPDTGGTPVEVDCDNYGATVLVLPNGDEVRYACPGSGLFLIHHVSEEDLPAPLATGPRFVAAVTLSVEQDGQAIITEEQGGYFLITFRIPEGMADERFSILFWDETANDGEGDWVELPRDQFDGQPIPLHPDTPEDEMLILRGVREEGGFVTVKVTFTGTFVLVAR
ncbi:MAG: right-handed parallel beta-helix repeat-containing protein [Anaerolineales bacterium]|nr:right-handed parallel beta-helix repeat-containing protein [Anaerolineales bacterium]